MLDDVRFPIILPIVIFAAPPRRKMPSNGLKSESRTITKATLRLAKPAYHPHMGAMVSKSPLDDPENAAHAWARYRRIMRMMLMVTIGTVLIAVALLYKFSGAVSVHYYIAAAVGISFTMLLGGGLMGLVFLSNGTGHDASVDNKMPDHDEIWSPKDED